MFTGLIQHVGRVAAVDRRDAGRRLTIDPRGWRESPEAGESVAISGCCLTVAEASSAGALVFDAVAETIAVTKLGTLGVGDRVNLERALRAGSLIGGHFVQGHVDGIGRVAAVRRDPGDWRVEVEPPGALMEYAVPKGSVAIDGVSLTIAAVGDDRFGVALIPETLSRTTLEELEPGAPVHLEMDILSKTVAHWMRRYGGGHASR